MRGYVLDIGPTFFLLATVSDRIWLDGFKCLRIGDVSEVGPDPHGAFAEAALRKRGERRPAKPRVSVADVRDLLRSAARAFPLVTIHRERVKPDACWIGKVLDVDATHVTLLEIDPAAKWEAAPNRYKLAEITRVSFGADYEGALHLVGGDPPVAAPAAMPKPVERRRGVRVR